MKRSKMTLARAVCALAITGCAAADDEMGGLPDAVEVPGGKGDFPTSNATVVPTANGNVALRSGFHTLYDKTHSRCVSPMEGSLGSPITVGESSRSFDIAYVRSREELAKELGIDLGLKVRYPSLAGDLGFELLDEFSATTRKVSFLLEVREDYVVRNKHPMELNGTGLKKLAAGAKQFTRVCGTHYVSGIRYGAQLFLLITYDAGDESTAKQIRSTMSVTRAAVDATPDLGVRMANAARLGNVGVTVRVASRGFSLGDGEANGNVIAQLLGGGGINSWTLDVIEDIRQDMEDSVARDLCRDLGEGDCGDMKAPGYFDNAQRFARPTGVEIGFYDALPNADVEGRNSEDVFETVIDHLTDVERYVRDFAELEERMTVAYQNDLQPFLLAPSGEKAAFNLAPPAEALRDPFALADVADEWTHAFRPHSGSQVGDLVKDATETIEDCWTKASVSIDVQCSEMGTRGEDTEAWKTIDAELARYHEEARIQPLRYVVGPSVPTLAEAEGVCAALTIGGDPVRLPDGDEVWRLAPLLGYGDLESAPAEIPHAAWYRDELACAEEAGMPYLVNDPADEDAKLGCQEDAPMAPTIATVCVPTTGPQPLEPMP